MKRKRWRVFIGIDNGVSGTIGVIRIDEEGFRKTNMIKMPSFSEQDYTKKKKNVTRVHTRKLRKYLKKQLEDADPDNVHLFMEVPMINPGRFTSTASALRAMEATLIVLDSLKLHRQWITSKEWQKELLPSGIKGAPEQKAASATVGKRMFPRQAELIDKHGDADGILICEWCRRCSS